MNVTMMISRYPPIRAGMELSCQRLSQFLTERGHRVTVVTEKIDSQQATDQMEAGVRVLRLSCFGHPPVSSAIYFLKALWRLLRRDPASDVLHAHMIAAPAMLALFVGRLCGIPVLVKMAGAGISGDLITSQRSKRGRLKLWLFRRLATDIVAVSPAIADEAQTIMRGRGTIHQIPNGVDMDFFTQATDTEKRQTRQTLNLPPQALIALYVGRWSGTKGLTELLQAFERGIEAPAFTWHLVLVIGGDFHPSSEEQKRLTRLGGRVHLAHNVADLRPYYHASDLAVLLSEGEGVSNFLLEAMACGLPTLASEAAAVAGIPSGIVFSKEDDITSRCLAELHRLQTTLDELRERGSRERQEVGERFSLNVIAGIYSDLYGRMIQGSRLVRP